MRELLETTAVGAHRLRQIFQLEFLDRVAQANDDENVDIRLSINGEEYEDPGYMYHIMMAPKEYYNLDEDKVIGIARTKLQSEAEDGVLDVEYLYIDIFGSNDLDTYKYEQHMYTDDLNLITTATALVRPETDENRNIIKDQFTVSDQSILFNIENGLRARASIDNDNINLVLTNTNHGDYTIRFTLVADRQINLVSITK